MSDIENNYSISFTCNSGQCIDRYRVCDGTKDCTDGSDETYGTCHAIQCPIYAYRCAYGACIAGSAKCNGLIDCADGSDELVQICGPTTIVSGTNTPPTPVGASCPLPAQPRNGRYTIMEGLDYRAITYTCAPNYQLYPANYRTAICQDRQWLPGHPICISSNTTYNADQDNTGNSNGSRCTDSCGSKFTCTNGQCIERHLLCDGTRDCGDGSDETLAQCSIIPCRKYSFRCAYGACIDSVAQCNGISECADGSDESLQICEPRVLAASQHCTLPSEPSNGQYTLKQHKGSLIITYKCEPNYAVHPVSNKLAICVDGQWVPGFARCLRTCAPLISQSIETYCDLDGLRQNCSTSIFDGTVMRMRCKQPYVQTGGTLNPVSTCRNGTWDTEFIKCVSAEMIW
ncbi:Lipophorin receptor 1 [Carabus blaptoides fortunei]